MSMLPIWVHFAVAFAASYLYGPAGCRRAEARASKLVAMLPVADADDRVDDWLQVGRKQTCVRLHDPSETSLQRQLGLGCPLK